MVSCVTNCFRPHVWGSFFKLVDTKFPTKAGNVFVPMFGDLFLNACQRRPIPWGSAERFAAGIGHGIHGALSSGIAVPIFSGLMDIGGDLMKRLHQILKVLRVLRCAKRMLNSRHSCDNKRILEPSSPWEPFMPAITIQKYLTVCLFQTTYNHSI